MPEKNFLQMQSLLEKGKVAVTVTALYAKTRGKVIAKPFLVDMRRQGKLRTGGTRK